MKITIFWDIKLRSATCFQAGILPGLFDPEDGGVGWFSMDYKALYRRWEYSS
jgi:hypothetical protein